jgi:hypothetical protein
VIYHRAIIANALVAFFVPCASSNTHLKSCEADLKVRAPLYRMN